jgi:hypothetical protein
MSDLVTQCKRRADKEFDDQISADEWKALISEQYGDLYAVVASAGLQYFEHTLSITTDGTARFDEPDDHMSTISLDRIVDSSGRRRVVRSIVAQERAAWAGRSGSEAQVYALVDGYFYFYPTPPAGQTYELLYIPQPPDLGVYLDSDIVDVVTPDGQAFLVWGVTVKALSKSESDVRLAIAEREGARERLLGWAADRAFLEPRRTYVDEDDGYRDPAAWRY